MSWRFYSEWQRKSQPADLAVNYLAVNLAIVEFASHVAACTFNEGAGAFLNFLSDMNITVGPSAHEYTTAEDGNRINRAEM